MRYVSYLVDHQRHVGEARGDNLVPLVGIDAIQPGIGSRELAQAARDETAAIGRGAVLILPVVPSPRRVICIGLNYRSHIKETQRADSDYPVLFPKFASSLIGAHDDILMPLESIQVDYEGELAVVIGAAGRRIRQEDAESHVLGYAVANDVTMRDYQYKTHQWMQGKAWDGSTPIGPEIVTPDEVDLPSAGIRTWVNGEKVQDSDLSRLIFPIPKLIATISEFTRLEEGDIILTGTPGGVGFRRDPQLFLHPGSTVVVEIDGVGRLESQVVQEELS